MANFGTYEPANKSQYQVCCITMNMGDRLRLLACPAEVIPLIRECIQASWGKIQDERPYNGSHEFKLKGYPWYGQGNDAVASRRLLAAILTVMAKNGWNLLQSSDVSKKMGDKDSLFFESGKIDEEASLFAVSFNMGDRIRIIDAPGFLPYVQEAVKQFWPRGIQNEREYCGSMELKLAGNPWYPFGEEAVYSKLLLCQLIANFHSVGYKLYASVDISQGHTQTTGAGHQTGSSDLESWVFRKIGPNWQ